MTTRPAVAPMDPDPVTETHFFGKFYHWTWKFDRKTKKFRMVLHSGNSTKCRRVHMTPFGDTMKYNKEGGFWEVDE